jgi:hypothetical protein
MTLPPPPKPVSVAATVLAALFFSGVYVARTAFPPFRMLNNPRLSELRNEQAQLAPFSDASAQAIAAKLGDLRGRLWTEASFNRWVTDRAPKAWIVQALGAADLKHLHGRRYAFQRPNSTDKDWPEIAAFLGNLEKAPGVSVQSVALAVQPGYAGSRQFSQCLLIAVFYFAGGDGPDATN